MEYRIRQHIEGIFAAAPDTAAARDAREEMIINVIERYHDLVSKGKSAEEAYRIAISGIGDISELLSELGAPAKGPAYSPAAPAFTPASPSPAPAQSERKGGSTAVKVVAIICAALLVLTIVCVIAGTSIFRSLFSKDGLIVGLVGNASDIFSGGAVNFSDGQISIGGDDSGFKSALPDDGEISLSAKGIEKIEVDWVNGTVQFKAGSGDDITFSEFADFSLNEENCLIYKVKGGTLSIRFCKSKTWGDINFDLSDYSKLNFTVPPKVLTVYIPESLLDGGLGSLVVNTVSANSSLTNMSAKTLEVNTVSGGMSVDSSAISFLKANGVSAPLTVSHSAVSELELCTVSGRIDVTGCAAAKLTLESISGPIYAGGGFDTLGLDTISGKMELVLNECPSKADIDSTSGGATMTLPGGAGFTVDFDSISGDLECAFPSTMDGGRLIAGGGEGKINFDSTSGDLTILKGE